MRIAYCITHMNEICGAQIHVRDLKDFFPMYNRNA